MRQSGANPGSCPVPENLSFQRIIGSSTVEWTSSLLSQLLCMSTPSSPCFHINISPPPSYEEQQSYPLTAGMQRTSPLHQPHPSLQRGILSNSPFLIPFFARVGIFRGFVANDKSRHRVVRRIFPCVWND